MQVAQIVWLVLLILFVVLEAATVAMVSIWFCAGALAALIVSFIWPGAWVVQIIAFLAVSVIMLLLLRPVARRLVGTAHTATNADANIGKEAQVVSEIQPGRFGRVKLEGLEWTAKCDSVVPVGAWVKVEAIEGVKLVVVPVAPAAPEM